MSGAKSIPRTDKPIGEDAYFLTEKVLAVADGVSGWYQYGVDSSLFSRQIMENCRKEVLAGCDLRTALSRAYAATHEIGSSTATMASLCGENFCGLNLGDSGFVYFRRMEGVYVSFEVSKEQQHNFNTPYQLSRLPTEENIRVLASHVSERNIKHLRESIARKELCEDQPEHADSYSIPAHEDDIVVLGTDGKTVVFISSG